MIIADFINKKLSKGDYSKTFNDIKTVDDLLSKIKVPEETKILIGDKKLFVSLISDKKYTDYTIEFIETLPIFNEQTVTQDLTNLHNGNIKYLKYKPQDKWLKTLGETVYIVNDSKLQREIVDKQNCCAFLPSDLKELNEGLKKNGEIPPSLVLKMFFNGKEIKEIERSNIEWQLQKQLKRNKS